jgi:NAD(P)-dependent dehydrogenase (short-subunit alcohol dehydrogenase family)
MKPKVIIITGANRGLGKQTTLELAKAGNIIIMACRNIQTSVPICEEIRQESGNDNIEVMELDLSSQASIHQFVENLKLRYEKVNILINNAGITSRYSQKTIDGLDLVVGTNYFGPYLLTSLIIPIFAQNEDNRIINITSNIYPYGQYDFRKINEYKWVKAYAVSKYLVLLFTLELAERLKEKGITVNAVHPGVVKTTIMFTKKWYDAIINTILLPFYVSVEEGAKTIVYLAASDDIKGITGQYFYKNKIKKVSNRYNDVKERKELFNRTNKILRIEG